jgi:hypothetical protein
MYNFVVTLYRVIINPKWGLGDSIMSSVRIGVQATHADEAKQKAMKFIGGGKWEATDWRIVP